MKINLLLKYLGFINALLVPARGRGFLSNFLFDSKNKRLPRKIIKQYWSGLIDLWEKGGKLTKPESVVESFSNKLDPSTFFCKGPKILDTNTKWCSRVIDAQDIITYRNIDLSKVGFLITGYISITQVCELEKRGLKGIAQGDMTSRRSFVWATKTQEIDNLQKQVKKKEIANFIRNKLGLLHFNEDQYLIEIVYPKDIVDDTLAAPTFIEGNPSLIYRSCNNVDGWGRACDMETYKDGLPEAVHPKVTFNENFRIRNLGRIKPPTPSFNWEIFLRGQKYKWHAGSITEIAKYV